MKGVKCLLLCPTPHLSEEPGEGGAGQWDADMRRVENVEEGGVDGEPDGEVDEDVGEGWGGR